VIRSPFGPSSVILGGASLPWAAITVPGSPSLTSIDRSPPTVALAAEWSMCSL
jgi:hypothetical protein